jgi:hypothetical protein
MNERMLPDAPYHCQQMNGYGNYRCTCLSTPLLQVCRIIRYTFRRQYQWCELMSSVITVPKARTHVHVAGLACYSLQSINCTTNLVVEVIEVQPLAHTPPPVHMRQVCVVTVVLVAQRM